MPRLQQEFHGADGRFVARCDYTWCGRLVGEFDGMVKYQKYVRTGETPFDVVRREKAREDAFTQARRDGDPVGMGRPAHRSREVLKR